MKKLYRRGMVVHPSPPSPTISNHQLSFLPATILTLTVTLSPEEKEVVAYILSCSSSSSFNGNTRRKTNYIIDGDHLPLFHCNCFHCYKSYWSRWNASPNHQLIHEIIDIFEGSISQTIRKEKKNKKGLKIKSSELNRSEFVMSSPSHASGSSSTESESVVESRNSNGVGEVNDEVEEKGFRKFLKFIGERIWWCFWGK